MHNSLIFGIISILVAIIVSVLFLTNFTIEQEKIVENVVEPSNNLLKLQINSLFNVYGYENDYEVIDGKKIWQNVEYKLKKENQLLYNEISNNDEKNIVVVYPIFTAAAYSEPGFYTYYRGECDDECLTITINENYPLSYQASGDAIQILSLLNYPIITDIDIDQDPSLLSKFDKVILLHNEYVTKTEFDAITSHPNVIYLYPNALYAEVSFDNENYTITLVRGHNYPEITIRNGFDWEYDNSELEYDNTCLDMKFEKIENGAMLNCYPENIIHKSKNLLKQIKEF